MKLIFEKNYIGLHTKKKKNTFNHFHRQTDQRRFYHSRGGNGSAPAGVVRRIALIWGRPNTVPALQKRIQ